MEIFILIICIWSWNFIKEKRRTSSSSTFDGTNTLAKTLIPTNEQAISLIQTSFNDSDSAFMSSKVQILPPTPTEQTNTDGSSSSFSYLNTNKEKLNSQNESEEFTL